MIINDFLKKLNDKNISNKECIVLNFDIFVTTLNTIRIRKIDNNCYLMTVIDELLPIKFFEYSNLNSVKNKIKKICEDKQNRAYKTIKIKSIQKC